MEKDLLNVNDVLLPQLLIQKRTNALKYTQALRATIVAVCTSRVKGNINIRIQNIYSATSPVIHIIIKYF